MGYDDEDFIMNESSSEKLIGCVELLRSYNFTISQDIVEYAEENYSGEYKTSVIEYLKSIKEE